MVQPGGAVHSEVNAGPGELAAIVFQMTTFKGPKRSYIVQLPMVSYTFLQQQW